MNATDDLIGRAAVIGLPIRKLTQKRGGYRDIGDTYHPRRVVEIYGSSYTLARARQLLEGLESGKITLGWVQAHSKS